MKINDTSLEISEGRLGLKSRVKRRSVTPEKTDDQQLSTLDKYSANACKALDMDMVIWDEHHLALEQAPKNLLLMYFIYINQYQFNPLCQDIILTQNPDQSWRLIITVDGWAKYLNRHPQFLGIQFEESAERTNAIPTWIECSIYRNDRSIPTTVREYYQEVKADHESWMQMPRRMLRHRALAQCARLAFGISPLDEKVQSSLDLIAANAPQEIDSVNCEVGQNKPKIRLVKSRVEILREKLGKSNGKLPTENLNIANENLDPPA